MSGHLIVCRVCGGTGRSQRATAIDCSNCAGRGTNWQKEDGSIAIYQGGPSIRILIVPTSPVPT